MTTNITKNNIYTNEEVKNFLKLLENDKDIQNFLAEDQSFALVDNYLLAIVFLYIKGAGLPMTKLSFFAALFLAHCIEEDSMLTDEIWRYFTEDKKLPIFREMIIRLSLILNQQAIVRLDCCQEVMASVPHPVWLRIRKNC